MSAFNKSEPDTNRPDYQTKWLDDGLYWSYGDAEWRKCDPQPHKVQSFNKSARAILDGPKRNALGEEELLDTKQIVELAKALTEIHEAEILEAPIDE